MQQTGLVWLYPSDVQEAATLPHSCATATGLAAEDVDLPHAATSPGMPPLKGIWGIKEPGQKHMK